MNETLLRYTLQPNRLDRVRGGKVGTRLQREGHLRRFKYFLSNIYFFSSDQKII